MLKQYQPDYCCSSGPSSLWPQYTHFLIDTFSRIKLCVTKPLVQQSTCRGQAKALTEALHLDINWHADFQGVWWIKVFTGLTCCTIATFIFSIKSNQSKCSQSQSITCLLLAQLSAFKNCFSFQVKHLPTYTRISSHKAFNPLINSNTNKKQ